MESSHGVLFVPYDAGEALAFEPLIPVLEDQGVSCQVLSLGTARQFFEGTFHAVELHRDLGVDVDVGPQNWRRGDSLSPEGVREVVLQLCPRLVCTGSVSEIQRQLAEGFKEDGVPVIAYCDALHRIQAGDWPSRFMKVVNEMWVAADAVANSIDSLGSNRPVRVVGQPSVEQWRVPRNFPEPLKAQPFWGQRVPVLFVSGYGDDFPNSFEVFLDSVRELPHCQFYVSVHPKQTGEQEREILAHYHGNNVSVLPQELRAREVAEFCKLIVCYRSTVGMQALFLGKPVLYVMVGEEHFSNLAIETGLAPRARDSDDLRARILEAIDSCSDVPDQESVLRHLGLPGCSVTLFCEELVAALNR